MEILYKKKIINYVSATQLHQLHNCKSLLAVGKSYAVRKIPNCTNCIFFYESSLPSPPSAPNRLRRMDIEREDRIFFRAIIPFCPPKFS